MSNIATHYRELAEKCNCILSSSLADERLSKISKSHNSLFEYSNWLDVLSERPEYSIYKVAIREFQMSLLSNNLGLYNQAFVGLRFFFERTLVAVLFSAKEVDLRLWQRGERDTYWQEIIDENSGIFSNKFCRAFFPALKDEVVHFGRMAQKVYRECSEFVHGNLSVQSKIPENLVFDEFLFNEWHSKAETIKRVVLFALCLRYMVNIKVENLQKIESVMLEEFGHIVPIRALFDSVKEI